MTRQKLKVDQLKDELLDMVKQNQETRDLLAKDGSLYDGYHPEMEAIHTQNAMKLKEIIEAFGWPNSELVGVEAERAAWLIAQHAIGLPQLMKSVVELLKIESKKRAFPKKQLAMMIDRICFLEGREQIYGTQYDWDENGELSPYPSILDDSRVDKRRLDMDLEPLIINLKRIRIEAQQSGEKPPTDLAEHRMRMSEWARKVGWRS